MADERLTIPLDELTRHDVALVGGKNASLGEMIRELGDVGVDVPDGFAITAHAYWRLVDAAGLREPIAAQLARLDDGAPLAEVGEAIRSMLLAVELPDDLREAIVAAYADLGRREGRDEPDVAVRSSATAEDLPSASFAGQQDSFLNVQGLEQLLATCSRCYASLFTDRAISYRGDHGFDHMEVALSIGVQSMVRSDSACAGVMFTCDTESGFPDTVVIDASWGLGEAVVRGEVDPDEMVVHTPLLERDDAVPIISVHLGTKRHKVVYDDREGGTTTTVPTSADERDRLSLDEDEVLQLARWGAAIEAHYGMPMDVEWAKDGRDGRIRIVQARPETVHGTKEATSLRTYTLRERGEPAVSGLAIGDAIATGTVCRIDDPADIEQFVDDGVLVTGMTDPDWEPLMKRAAAIVTDRGGRTSHAAIVSRELGVAAVIGTGDATAELDHGEQVTVSCAEGDRGHVYRGLLAYDADELDIGEIPATRTKVMLNVADPSAVMRWWRLPADGVGLARMEFVINNHVRAHPMALLHPDRVDADARRRIDELARGYHDPARYFVDQLAYGLARIAACWHPKPVVVRTSDFKTNEYARLLGGEAFEPAEENPMLGWRGASRYASPAYREAFALELQALRKVRERMGLDNVVVMIPFCRTVGEGEAVLELMAEHGMARGERGLQVLVMAEIPSNVVLADRFAEHFDGFSIGSNDLAQLVLGVSRESEELADLFDEADPAVTRMIEQLITTAHAHGRPVGLCGQRPSDDADFAAFLVRAGIDSMSVTPDAFLRVKQHVARAEQQAGGEPQEATAGERPASDEQPAGVGREAARAAGAAD